MLPDVVDDFTMKNPSCRDLEPLFFSCYAFCSKLAGGLSVGISTLILQFVGYRAGACHHEGGVATALIVMFSPVPVALLLIGMFFFHSYPINERKCLQEQLTPDHPEASSPADLKEDSEQLPSTSHHNTSYNPNSSAGPEKQSSVKSSGRSLASSENTRSKSVLKSNVNPQSPTSPQRSGDEKRSRNVPEKNPRTSSSGSHVRPKMSWV